MRKGINIYICQIKWVRSKYILVGGVLAISILSPSPGLQGLSISGSTPALRGGTWELRGAPCAMHKTCEIRALSLRLVYGRLPEVLDIKRHSSPLGVQEDLSL